jgi:hypothetical protein
MNRFLAVLFCLAACLPGAAQQPFFNTDVKLTTNDLKDFYSAATVVDDQILFIANDYTLYAFDKISGAEKWKLYLDYKSQLPPFKINSSTVGVSAREGTYFVDLNTGQVTDTLWANIYTEPFIRNNVLYTTGIYDGGSIVAYDLVEKKVLWYKFISHGCMVRPYYRSEHMLVNAEGDQWVEISYDGRILKCKEEPKLTIEDNAVEEESDTLTETRTSEEPQQLFLGELSCVEEFSFVSHDNLKVTAAKVTKLFGEEIAGVRQVMTSATHTLVLQEYESKMLVLGARQKKIEVVDFYNIAGRDESVSDFTEILKIEGVHVWIAHNGTVFNYDLKNKKVTKSIDLAARKPSVVFMSGNDFWVIDRETGQLYGFR